MLSKYTKYFIIALIQLTGLALVMLTIAPLLLHHTNDLNKWHDVFTRFDSLFFIGHLLFYVVLYFSWPPIIGLIASRQLAQPQLQQINQAFRARYFLIGTFLIFELIHGLR